MCVRGVFLNENSFFAPRGPALQHLPLNIGQTHSGISFCFHSMKMTCCLSIPNTFFHMRFVNSCVLTYNYSIRLKTQLLAQHGKNSALKKIQYMISVADGASGGQPACP
jgi:hypothetical protein